MAHRITRRGVRGTSAKRRAPVPSAATSTTTVPSTATSKMSVSFIPPFIVFYDLRVESHSGGGMIWDQVIRWISQRQQLHAVIADTVNDPDRDVVVYSSDVIGNPTGCKRVVRWLLFGPTAETIASWSSTDIIVDYAPVYRTLDGCLWGAGEKTPSAVDTVLFVTKPNLPRCIDPKWSAIPQPFERIIHGWNPGVVIAAYRKRRVIDGDKYPQPTDVLRGTKYEGMTIKFVATSLPPEYVAWLMKKADLFLSYDPFTFYNSISPMMGTPTLIVPIARIHRSLYCRDNVFMQYGSAYGVEMLSHAFSTVSKVNDHMRRCVFGQNSQALYRFQNILKRAQA